MNDLFGEVPPPKQKPVKHESAIVKVEQHYRDAFAKHSHGGVPLIKFGKERAHLRDLIATWGEAGAIGLVDKFFASTTPRIIRSDYSITALYINAQALSLGDRYIDDRTAANWDAAARATGRVK